MIDDRTIQVFLRDLGVYNQGLDGKIGPKTYKAILAALLEDGIQAKYWNEKRLLIGVQQMMFLRCGLQEAEVGPVDGYDGPRFDASFRHFQDLQRTHPMWVDDSHIPRVWPSQRDVPAFFGPPGTDLVKMSLPYPMVLDWNPTETIKQVTVHRLVSESLESVLMEVRNAYGDAVFHNGLNRYGGTFNMRPMTGNSQKMSMHSWGIAIDIWPSQNKYEWTKQQAELARPDYEPLWACFEREGWVSLGRQRDRDWMHVQAARF